MSDVPPERVQKCAACGGEYVRREDQALCSACAYLDGLEGHSVARSDIPPERARAARADYEAKYVETLREGVRNADRARDLEDDLARSRALLEDARDALEEMSETFGTLGVADDWDRGLSVLARLNEELDGEDA